MPRHPVRLCTHCKPAAEWPASSPYNLCPRCQKNTTASSSTIAPDYAAAFTLFQHYEAVREFDAKADAEALKQREEWDASMEALLERTPTIPDPSPYTNPPPRRPTRLSPQDVRFYTDNNADEDADYA